MLKVPYILRSPEKKRVCAWKYLSLVLGHADRADKWVCLCLDVFLELNMSARGCGGSSSSLPGTPGGEAGQANNVLSWAVSIEKLLEDPYGVRQFTVRHAQHTCRYFVFRINSSGVFLATSQGLPYVLIHSVCVFICSPSWCPRWVRRTFYSGKLVKNSGRSQPAPWMRYDGTYYLFTWWSMLLVISDSLCWRVFTLRKLPFHTFVINTPQQKFPDLYL